jgi:hypothetical protein
LQNNARQKAKTDREKESKMAAQVAAELAEIDELYELAEELLQLRLSAAIEIIAEWQRQARRPFPALFAGPRAEHETPKAHYARQEKARKLGLIRMMAANHIQKHSARRRKAVFDVKEANEAAALGMTTDAYRKHKKGLKLASQMQKILADRAAA